MRSIARLRAADIPARGRKSPAGVFDEAADAHIRAEVRGFRLLRKFAVAVIHHQSMRSEVLLCSSAASGAKSLGNSVGRAA